MKKLICFCLTISLLTLSACVSHQPTEGISQTEPLDWAYLGLLPVEPVVGAISLLTHKPLLHLAVTNKDICLGNQEIVVVIPGLWTGDVAVSPIVHSLNQLGFTAFSWQQGLSLIDFEQNDQSFYEFVLKLFLEHDQKISLVGWSIGGARAVKFAYEHPELVKQVITLGTPYRTSPVLDALSKYVYRDIHEAVTNLSCAIPLTAIYGQIDSLVRGKNGALLNENLDQLCWRENVPVFTNHYGIGYSISALRVIAEKLSSDVPSTHKD